jgi:hypothetical protein
MFEAGSILSAFLSEAGIPHAFYGGITSVALGSPRETEEIYCVVEGGFRNVRKVLHGSEIMTASASSWSGRLFVTYHDPIPPIEVSSPGSPPFAKVTPVLFLSCDPPSETTTHTLTWPPKTLTQIEILNAGETGPKRLNRANVMVINQLPFLSISEFIRAKINVWLAHGSEGDAADIIYVLSQFAASVDINRIPEPDMDRFVTLHPGEARQAWASVRSRYGL